MAGGIVPDVMTIEDVLQGHIESIGDLVGGHEATDEGDDVFEHDLESQFADAYPLAKDALSKIKGAHMWKKRLTVLTIAYARTYARPLRLIWPLPHMCARNT